LAGINYGSDGYDYGSNGPAGLDYSSGDSPDFDYSSDGFAGIVYDSLDSDGTNYGSDDLEGIGEPHLIRMALTTNQATWLASTMTLATRLASIRRPGWH
jgi:hypothetical protein